GEHTRRTQRGRNVIRSARYCLAWIAAVCRRYVVASQEVATACGQRIWIRIPVGLAVRVGRPCGGTRVDREARTRIGDAVVGEHARRIQRGSDVIRTACYRLAWIAA